MLLPPESLARAGMILISVSAGPNRATAIVDVLPGPPVAPLQPLIGPHSIPADGSAWTVAAVVPQDALGNAIADGTAVVFRVRPPGGSAADLDATTRTGVAWTRISSTTRAGRGTIAPVTGTTAGYAGTWEQVAGVPGPFAVSVSPPEIPADGRSMAAARTGLLADRWGNPLPDGTLVTFIASQPGTDNPRRIVTAETIGGVAEAPMQADDRPGTLLVVAEVNGVHSAPASLHSTALTAAPMPVVALVDIVDGVLAVQAGPVAGDLGSIVADGAPVTFRIVGPGGMALSVERPSLGGRAIAEFRLSGLAPGTWRITARNGAASGEALAVIPSSGPSASPIPTHANEEAPLVAHALVVTTRGVNLRDLSAAGAPVVAVAPKDTPLEVVAPEQNGMVQVSMAGLEGWVPVDSIRIVEGTP